MGYALRVGFERVPPLGVSMIYMLTRGMMGIRLIPLI